ncbi:telomere end binding [Trichoderma cornu-damae]|uniref:Telomere end binding n=1 Tax=Trichoderma cornu-damae TaxID=654480 RepID=A0A9P8U0L1_9HYPO|nr:telomere end binding [Trichoderma cornu-damae]
MAKDDAQPDVLCSTEATPIAKLGPAIAIADAEAAVVEGVVTVTWPYSVVSKSIAFILAERDPLHRRDKGQLRVEFHGAAGKALVDSSLGGGDEVRLSLGGVQWEENQAAMGRPGMLEWQMKFTNRLLLKIRRADTQEVDTISVDASGDEGGQEAPEQLLRGISPSPSMEIEQLRYAKPLQRTPLSTIPSKRFAHETLGPGEYASPAFLKRARVSYGSLFEGGFDIFDEEEPSKDPKETKRKQGKKTKSRFSMNPTSWRYTSRSPTPEAEPAEDEDEDEDEDEPKVDDAEAFVVEEQQAKEVEMGDQPPAAQPQPIMTRAYDRMKKTLITININIAARTGSFDRSSFTLRASPSDETNTLVSAGHHGIEAHNYVPVDEARRIPSSSYRQNEQAKPYYGYPERYEEDAETATVTATAGREGRSSPPREDFSADESGDGEDERTLPRYYDWNTARWRGETAEEVYDQQYAKHGSDEDDVEEDEEEEDEEEEEEEQGEEEDEEDDDDDDDDEEEEEDHVATESEPESESEAESEYQVYNETALFAPRAPGPYFPTPRPAPAAPKEPIFISLLSDSEDDGDDEPTTTRAVKEPTEEPTEEPVHHAPDEVDEQPSTREGEIIDEVMDEDVDEDVDEDMGENMYEAEDESDAEEAVEIRTVVSTSSNRGSSMISQLDGCEEHPLRPHAEPNRGSISHVEMDHPNLILSPKSTRTHRQYVDMAEPMAQVQAEPPTISSPLGDGISGQHELVAVDGARSEEVPNMEMRGTSKSQSPEPTGVEAPAVLEQTDEVPAAHHQHEHEQEQGHEQRADASGAVDSAQPPAEPSLHTPDAPTEMTDAAEVPAPPPTASEDMLMEDLQPTTLEMQPLHVEAEVEIDVVEQDVVEQDVVDQDVVDQDVVDQDVIDQDVVEQDVVEQDVVEQDVVEQDVVEQDVIEQDVIEQDVVDQDVVDQDAVDQDVVDQDVVEQDVEEQDVEMQDDIPNQLREEPGNAPEEGRNQVDQAAADVVPENTGETEVAAPSSPPTAPTEPSQTVPMAVPVPEEREIAEQLSTPLETRQDGYEVDHDDHDVADVIQTEMPLAEEEVEEVADEDVDEDEYEDAREVEGDDNDNDGDNGDDFAIEQQLMSEFQHYSSPQKARAADRVEPAFSQPPDAIAEKPEMLITLQSLRSHCRAKRLSSDSTESMSTDPSVLLARSSPIMAHRQCLLGDSDSLPQRSPRSPRSKAEHSDPSIALAKSLPRGSGSPKETGTSASASASASLRARRGVKGPPDASVLLAQAFSPPPERSPASSTASLRAGRRKSDKLDPSVLLATASFDEGSRRQQEEEEGAQDAAAQDALADSPRDGTSEPTATGHHRPRSPEKSAVKPPLRPPSAASSVAEDSNITSLKLQLLRNLRINVPDCLPLKSLRASLTKTADILAVATVNPHQPHRPKHGPRDYMLELYLTDPSVAPTGVTIAHIFRPHQASLPTVQAGDIVLLRRVQVVSMQGRGFGIRAGDASAWAVFERDDEEMLPQIKGPPVEVTDEEVEHVQGLRRWWGLQDDRALEKIHKANQRLSQAAGDEMK